MKIMTKLNLLSVGIVLVMTLSVLGVGTLIINDILYRLEEQVLRLELANATQSVLQRLNRAGARAAAETAAQVHRQLQQKDGLKTAQLYVVEAPDNRVVYYPGLSPGDKLGFGFIEQMFQREQGLIEYDLDGTSYYSAFTTVYPLNWLIGLSISKAEMLEKRSSFLGNIGAVTFLALLVNALLVSFFGQRLLRRIEAALSCVKRIEQGELSARIAAPTAADEIGHLQDGINAMSARIQQRTLAQQTAERALREREARIRRLMESNIIGIFFWGLDGSISDANDAFLGMLGYSREDLQAGSISWAQMTPPEYQAADERAGLEWTASGSCQPYEKEFFRKDGSRIPVLIGGALFEESKEHGVAFVLDLTERKQAEADRQARLAAEDASRAKSEFLANMSHELRTPLNAVLGYAQILLQEKGLNERQATGLKTIQQSGEHLLTLITDLLDLAKIEAGKLELFPTQFNLPAFLRTIANIIRIRAEEKDLLFILDLAADLPPVVEADEKRLRQVLLNLLGNAVKFTERGHVRLRVRRLPSEALSTRLVFEVDDTGVGMREDQLEVIFQPFEQVGDVQRRAGGTGLGLAISRQLVHLMESEIQVTSQEGEGSLFSFELALPVVAGAAAAAAVTTRRPSGYLGARRKVLVVDDVVTNRVLMVHLLQRFGFEVSEASNGQEGLERALASPPDLILMDLMMPVMDGLEATRRMRRTPELAQLPIIILSASAAREDQAAGEAAGASGFVYKPIDPYGLVQELGRHLRLSWVYPPSPAEPEVEPAAAPLVAPPPEEMATLYEMVMAGSMRGIRQEATRLAELDRRYRPFADRLLQLAQGGQSQALLSLVERFMERQENP